MVHLFLSLKIKINRVIQPGLSKCYSKIGTNSIERDGDVALFDRTPSYKVIWCCNIEAVKTADQQFVC